MGERGKRQLMILRIMRAVWVAFVAPLCQSCRDWVHRRAQQARVFLVVLTTLTVRIILPATLSCALIIFAGGFPLRQGIVLGLMIAGVYWWIGWTREETVKPPWRFDPYRMRVTPNWHKLLVDFKLISDEDYWRLACTWRLYEDDLPAKNRSAPIRPHLEHRVLRDGISFTVLKRIDGPDQTLIYSDSQPQFRTAARFDEVLGAIWIVARDTSSAGGTIISSEQAKVSFTSELVLDDTVAPDSESLRSRFKIMRFKVFMFVNYGPEGYDLGISVPGAWWEAMSALCPTPSAVKPMPGSFVDLVLATMPRSEVEGYYDPEPLPVWRRWSWESDYYKYRNDLSARQDKDRLHFGWKRSYQTPGSRAIESIDHRYFNVRHCRADETSDLDPWPLIFFR
jgi:hypothetical protein